MVVCRRALIGLCSAAAIAAALYWYSKSRVLEHRDPDDVKSILNGVVSQLESNRPAEAVVVLDDLLKRNPGEPQALLYRGQAARMLGDSDSAIRWWSQIDEQSLPQAGMARFLEGTVAIERHHAAEAERLWREAVRLHPRFIKSRERLVDLYVRQLRTDDVRKQLREIREVRPWTPIEYVLYRMASGVIKTRPSPFRNCGLISNRTRVISTAAEAWSAIFSRHISPQMSPPFLTPRRLSSNAIHLCVRRASKPHWSWKTTCRWSGGFVNGRGRTIPLMSRGGESGGWRVSPRADGTRPQPPGILSSADSRRAMSFISMARH